MLSNQEQVRQGGPQPVSLLGLSRPVLLNAGYDSSSEVLMPPTLVLGLFPVLQGMLL